jgi:hypothetical protein
MKNTVLGLILMLTSFVSISIPAQATESSAIQQTNLRIQEIIDKSQRLLETITASIENRIKAIPDLENTLNKKKNDAALILEQMTSNTISLKQAQKAMDELAQINSDILEYFN